MIVLLAPIILVVLTGCALLASEPFFRTSEDKHRVLPWLGLIGILLAGATLCMSAGACSTEAVDIYGLFAFDHIRIWLDAAVFVTLIAAYAGMQSSLSRDCFAGGESYALATFSAVGVLLMIHAVDGLALFIAIECASLPIYALVGLRRKDARSNEGLFKYFIMGAVFSAIYLYGVALAYGASGSTGLGDPAVTGQQDLLAFGRILMIIGLLFKVGAVPFHFWAPDAYSAAPISVTGFMAAVMKIGGFVALGTIWMGLVQGHTTVDISAIRTVVIQESSQLDRWSFLLVSIAMLSLLIGNFSALGQQSFRRMLAFSSVAHAGYVLLGFALPQGSGTLDLTGAWYYLIAYAVATAAVLAGMSQLSGANDADNKADIQGSARRSPLAGLAVTVGLISLAGLPPTAGFLGKYLIFADLVDQGRYTLALAGMVLAVVGAVYYLGFVASIWNRDESLAAPSQARKQSLLTTIVLVVTALAVFALLALPQVFVVA